MRARQVRSPGAIRQLLGLPARKPNKSPCGLHDLYPMRRRALLNWQRAALHALRAGEVFGERASRLPSMLCWHLHPDKWQQRMPGVLFRDVFGVRGERGVREVQRWTSPARKRAGHLHAVRRRHLLRCDRVVLVL